jgi:hypothetical protein
MDSPLAQSLNGGVVWVANCIRCRITLSVFGPNHITLHKTSVNQLDNDLFRVSKYNNVFTADVRTICVLCLLSSHKPLCDTNI